LKRGEKDMHVTSATTAAVSGMSTGASSGKPAEDPTKTFMTLLVAQLKAQDPTSPMDPKEMVGQLVQFNSLSQLMEIRGLLEEMSAGATPEGGN